MHAPAKEAFHKALQQLKLSHSSTVVVGLSGGPDSVALTYLARQTFRRVIAVTVDHKLRDESGDEAEKAGQVARSLGAEHTVVPLDWGKEGRGRTASRARRMRYTALVQQCQRLNSDVLMMGHHLNDQIETMLYRLMMGSGIVGLGGMHLTTHWAIQPEVTIVRPLLNCTKASLVQLCRDEGLEWTEDPSNQKPVSPRNQIRPILVQHPDLVPGLADIMSLCREVMEVTKPHVREAMERLACVNGRYGTVSFDTAAYKALNPYIARSVLAIWLRFTASSGNSINRYGLQKLHDDVTEERTVPDTNNNCILIPLPKERRFLLAKQKPMTTKIQKIPIQVGETIVWNNRFTISLFVKPTRKGKESNGALSEELKSRMFYVRHFLASDNEYMARGVRKVRSTVLVHYHVRGGLPVIVDSSGNVVLIPHFKVMDHTVGVDCKVAFTPRWTMRELLQFHYISEDSLLDR